MRTLLLLCLIGTMSCMAFGQTYEYLNVADDGDYEISQCREAGRESKSE